MIIITASLNMIDIHNIQILTLSIHQLQNLTAIIPNFFIWVFPLFRTSSLVKVLSVLIGYFGVNAGYRSFLTKAPSLKDRVWSSIKLTSVSEIACDLRNMTVIVVMRLFFCFLELNFFVIIWFIPHFHLIRRINVNDILSWVFDQNIMVLLIAFVVFNKHSG